MFANIRMIPLMAVSIHAPPEGRDAVNPTAVYPFACFNPRAPGGARFFFGAGNVSSNKFQSTRPRRGAINQLAPQRLGLAGFNPRAPGGARSFATALITVHKMFQSTRPRRGAIPYFIAYGTR